MARSMSPSVYMWFACSLVIACTAGDGPAGATADAPGPTETTFLFPPGIFHTDPGGDTAEKLDLPADDGEGTAVGDEDLGPRGCEKVDFLFVIDNSKSMADEQKSLIASFPGFIAAIEQTLTAQDYHIMAISTDNGDPDNGDSDCDFDSCVCAPAPTCCKEACDTPFDRTCNGISCADITVDYCDFQYGAGRNHDQWGTRCAIAGDRRYMLADQPELEATFACAAGIGVFGSGDERPIQAALTALGPAHNGPGGCNEGFLRDDALLMVTFVFNSPDTFSAGTPKQWADAITKAKHGDLDSVVLFSISEPECSPWDNVCDLVKYFFPYWHIIHREEPDYSAGFEVATGLVEQACSQFIPQ